MELIFLVGLMLFAGFIPAYGQTRSRGMLESNMTIHSITNTSTIRPAVVNQNQNTPKTPGNEKNGQSTARMVCDFCLYDGEGNFSSYDYPAPYRKDLDCTYRVKRVDGACHLEVSFHDFELQGVSDEPCLTDYLLIHGKRYCGKAWKGKTALVPFYPELDEVTFRFHSDSMISKGGFWMEIKKQSDSCTLAAQESCNRSFLEEEFLIRSPKFPENYNNNQQCLYSVIKHSNDICGLEFTFLSFNIEPSDNCAYDFLQVNGKKMCGTISSNGVRVFMFSEEEMIIQFSSDNQNNRAGFNIKVRQITKCYPEKLESSTSVLSPSPPSCNIYTSSINGEIFSWGYPFGYIDNLSCQFSISRKNDQYCRVEIEFLDFDVDFTIGCTGDFLQIAGQKHCGTSLRGQKHNMQFDASGNAILLFETDRQSVKKGFKIKYRQISCAAPAANIPTAPPTSCSFVYDQKEFYLRSPNYPSNYSNNLDCRYVVRRQGDKICALEIMFNYFDIEISPNCSKDSFEVNGEKYCDRLVENVVRTFPFQTVDKVLTFHSDTSTTRTGFFMHIVQQECDPRSAATSNDECNQEIREPEFEIKSPDYPEKYKDDLSCQYIVHRTSSSICDLVLNIQDFQLQEGEVCENDYLQVGEERLCGNIEKGTIRTYDFGNQDEIILNFETDSSSNERGFILSGTQRDCSTTDQTPFSTTMLPVKPVWESTESLKCDRTVVTSEDILNSPEYPSNYPDNVDCQYQINRVSEKYCELEITINNLHIQVGDSCQYDYLEVDGHRFCGSTTAGNKRIFSFKSNQITINFHSDFSINDRGFEVMLKQRECSTPTTEKPRSKSCDEVFGSREFIFTSPNFPSEYDSSLDCKYIIRRSDDSICKLEMLFIAFDVESSSDCEYDYLLINGEKICGIMENVTRTYLFQDYEKVLTFHSDSGTSRSGFMIQGHQLECFSQTTEPTLPLKPCDRQFSSTAFEIRSDNHPSHYDPNINCVYTIIRANQNICSIEMTFLNFDVESSDSCQYDYLEVDEEKLCGVYPTNLKRSIKFVSPEIILQFHSDGATSRPGFHLKLHQMECIPILSSTIAPTEPIPVPISCDKRHANLSGTFNSPYFPHQYPNNVHCVYTFVAQPGYCRITLNFLEFSLHTDDSICEQDYIEINRIKYCGPQLLAQTRTVTFYGSPREINVAFRTDGHNEEKGFYATYRQLPCTPASERSPKPRKQPAKGIYVPSCDRLYASLKFRITSPEHPNHYPEDRDCRYTIRRLTTKICQLRLTFTSFDIESGEDCEYDYLEVNGMKLCGTLPAETSRDYEIQDYQTIIKFHSDSANTGNGFVIQAEQVECTAKPPPVAFPPARDPHPPLVIAETPLDGDHFVYPPHIIIKDYEHLFDPPRHPHYPHIHRKLPAAEGSNVYDYRNCDRTYQQEKFEIKSVNFPANYPNSLNCRYIVKKAHNDICWVKLTFIRFDVEISDDCHFDYLSINNKRICGTLPDDEIRAYIFTSDEISMYFRSDAATPHRGFMIKGEQLKCRTSPITKPVVTSACDQTYEKDIFVIQSPGFPTNYPDSVDCQYNIKKVNKYICGLELKFLTFDIENDVDCEKDYIFVDGEKLCGPIPSKTIRHIPVVDAETKISFHSNEKNSRPGFSILVKQLEDCDDQERSTTMTNCDLSTDSERFIFHTPLFPDDYPADITCHYNIHRFSSSVCRIELSILNFDVEDQIEGKCDNDYLELDVDNKICGHLPKGYTLNINFNEKDLQFTFHSDHSTQRPGFSIQAHQVTTCEGSRSPVQSTVVPAITSSSCDQIFMAQEFSIKSPNFPNDYPHNITCTYTIHPASTEVCSLELWFAHFDLEEGPECSYDYLNIGHKSICGQLPSGFSRVVPFDTTVKIFIFHSDKGTSKSGFAIKIKQLLDCGSTWKPATPPPQMCNHCLKDNRGHIISPGYPDDYSNNLRCEYHLERVKGFCGLEIYFHDFHLEQSHNCTKDFVSIDGKRYCGLELKRQIKKMHFPIGDPNEVLLQFHTDSSERATGFHAEYHQLPCRGYPWRQGRAEQAEGSSEWTPSNVTRALGGIFPAESRTANSDIHPVYLLFNHSHQNSGFRYNDHQNVSRRN